MSSGNLSSRNSLARGVLLLLALGGLFVLALAALAAVTHCYDICDEQSEEWYSRPGAWERWAQLVAALVLALLLGAAARAGLRDQYRAAAALVLASGPVLVVWLVIFIVNG